MTPFGKLDSMLVHSEDPLNAESARAPLAEHALTPADRFYVRNHGPVPEPAPGAWRLRIGGLVGEELELSLADLRDGDLQRREVAATLQCAGNRRS
ncbi:MAG: putative oxidoreductase, partial [Conexibacter sp.]|nr:putative oxidoreductase [Conexibacter sp.]